MSSHFKRRKREREKKKCIFSPVCVFEKMERLSSTKNCRVCFFEYSLPCLKEKKGEKSYPSFRLFDRVTRIQINFCRFHFIHLDKSILSQCDCVVASLIFHCITKTERHDDWRRFCNLVFCFINGIVANAS